MATPLAIHIRKRVRDERRLADGSWPGYARSNAVAVSPEYQSAAGLPKQYYPSSAALHSALPGARSAQIASVTGKMWEGLQVRGSGTSKAIIDFGGSSLGSESKLEKLPNGRRRLVAKSGKVRNSTKAGRVFVAKKINIIQPSQTENVALADALSQVVGVEMAIAFDADRLTMATQGEQSLVESVKRALSA